MEKSLTRAQKVEEEKHQIYLLENWYIFRFLKKWDCILTTNRDYILKHTEDNSSLKEVNDAFQVILETHVAEVLHQVSKQVCLVLPVQHPGLVEQWCVFYVYYFYDDIISSQYFLSFNIMSYLAIIIFNIFSRQLLFLPFNIMSYRGFIIIDIIASQCYLVFDVLSQLAFITFIPMSFHRYLPFKVLSFWRFLAFNNFQSTFCPIRRFSIKVFYHCCFLLQHIVGESMGLESHNEVRLYMANCAKKLIWH
jgi:hypothetical protein